MADPKDTSTKGSPGGGTAVATGTGTTTPVKPTVDTTHTGTGILDALRDGPVDPLMPTGPSKVTFTDEETVTASAAEARKAQEDQYKLQNRVVSGAAELVGLAAGEKYADKVKKFGANVEAQQRADKANENALVDAAKVDVNRAGIAFSEQRLGPHPAYYVAARVFISGVEVTHWLTGSLSVTYAGRDGHNTASFTLQSAADNFIITGANAPGLQVLAKDYVTEGMSWDARQIKTGSEVKQKGKGVWRMAPDMPLYSEHAKRAIYEYKNKSPRNPVLQLDGQQQARATTGKDNYSGSRMWPLQAHRPIFHKNDPVRIFIHNPLHHPKDESDEQWLPAFAGFIEGYPWSEDYLTGHTDITISCYDLRALMRYMRVINVLPQAGSTGPNSPAGKELNLLRQYFGQDAGSMFLMMELNTMNKNVLARLRFETAVGLLTIGDAFPGAAGAFGAQGKLPPVGPLFSMGQVLYYGGTDSNLEKIGTNSKHSTSSTELDAWHTLCLCGPKDLSRYGVTGKRPDPFLSNRNVEQLGVNTVWWDKNGAPGRACPANQQLHMLLPGGGTVFNTLYGAEQAGAAMESVDLDYTDRFTLLNDLCNLLDYQWMVSPFGDLVFEFPMYDFFPAPGDRVPGSSRSTKAGAAPSSAAPVDKKHMGFAKWSGVMSLDWHLTSASYNEESGEITTILFADGPLNLFGESSPTGSFQNRSMLFVPTLLRRLGAVTATQNFTFITKKTAICRAGLLELRRRLARVATMEVQFIYRPFLLPNRPLYVAPRQRCGTVNSVTHSMEINANASTSASLQYVRQRDQFGNWTHVTGAENMPLDFTLMSDYANFKDFAKNRWIVDGICAPCLDEAGADAPGGGGTTPPGKGKPIVPTFTPTPEDQKKYGPTFRNMRPEAQGPMTELLARMNKAGEPPGRWAGRVTAGYTYNPKADCPDGYNPHLAGIAADFNLKGASVWALDADGKIPQERLDFYKDLGEQAHAMGLKWGGDWQNARGNIPPEFKAAAKAQDIGVDPPHVQLVSDGTAQKQGWPKDFKNPDRCQPSAPADEEDTSGTEG